jgi:hypothetical protein
MQAGAWISLDRHAKRRLAVGVSTVAVVAFGGLSGAAVAATDLHPAAHRPERGGMHRGHRSTARGRGAGSSVSCAGGVCFTGDPFYLYAGQCTWYAAGRRPDLDGIVHGNAGDWLNEARGRAPEGTVPAVGAIAVWLPNTGGLTGRGTSPT